MPPKNNDHFLDAVQNRVWALHPGKLEEVAVFIEKRLSAQTIDFPEAAKGKGGDKADDRYEVRDGVAILPVYGVLSKRINMMAMISGGSSTEILARNFKAALLEGRRMFIYWRNWLARKLCQPVYEMVLEEAFLRGMFDAKNFYEFKHEYCRANWIGGGWGWVDPVKEIEASRMAIDYGLSTLAEEAAGQGRDWEEIVEQRKKEETFIEKEGVNISRSKKGLEADKTGEKEDATKK